MPYETGTATNLQDLLSKLGTFAAANGWTVHFSGARTGGAGSNGHALILSRGAVQGILRSNNSAGSVNNPGPFLEALLWSGTYSAATTETQANLSAAAFPNTNGMAGPFVAYHAFTPAGGAPRPYLHVAVEVTSGVFRHFGIGQLRQMGAFTNGAYAHGTNPSGQAGIINDATSFWHSYPFDPPSSNANNFGTIVRADFGGVVPRYCQGNVSDNAVGSLRGGFREFNEPGRFGSLASSMPSAFTGRAALLPLLVMAQVDTLENLRSPVGWPDDFRYIDVTNFNPGDTITLGSDTWRIFPAVRKGPANSGPPGIPNSWRYGYAYRQNA